MGESGDSIRLSLSTRSTFFLGRKHVAFILIGKGDYNVKNLMVVLKMQDILPSSTKSGHTEA